MGEQSEKIDRGYDLLSAKLERWLDELSERGPSAMPDIFREMAVTVSPTDPQCEPCIDFDHQKNYN